MLYKEADRQTDKEGESMCIRKLLLTWISSAVSQMRDTRLCLRKVLATKENNCYLIIFSFF